MSLVILLAALLLFGCGEEEQEARRSGGGATFRVQVSGAADRVIESPGDTAQMRFEKVGDMPGGYIFWFGHRGQGKGYAVTLVYYGKTPPAARTHDIRFDAGAETLAGFIANFVTQDPLATYGQDPAGQITLTREGESYGGDFTFEAGSGPPGDDPKTVTVEGHFAGLALTPAASP